MTGRIRHALRTGHFGRPAVTRTDRIEPRGMVRDYRVCADCGQPLRPRDRAL
jgi:hypothetical protein